jgi:hypothetical protein
MADAADSKSADRKVVKVRLLSPALYTSVSAALPQNMPFARLFDDFALRRLCNGMKQKSVLGGFI